LINYRIPKALKLIAVLKVIRGIGALALAACLFWLSQQDLSVLGENLFDNPYFKQVVESTEIDPTWLSNLSKFNLFGLSVLALLLSIVRFSEAVGIWYDQTWAEWLAVFTGFITAGFFMWGLVGEFNWTTLFSLCVTILIVAYLLRILLKKRSISLSKSNSAFRNQARSSS
jgi:uncharacterized membrane protein (DUF2068 family)